MRAAVMSMAKPRLEFHRPPDPGFLIEGFHIQCPDRSKYGWATFPRVSSQDSAAVQDSHRPRG
eukprot:9500881-Pyramimonas_sp.AAC.1